VPVIVPAHSKAPSQVDGLYDEQNPKNHIYQFALLPDDVPLAIKLAARARVLTVEQIAARLDDNKILKEKFGCLAGRN
jgi:hypothetical protein